jgi:hypothetical protein
MAVIIGILLVLARVASGLTGFVRTRDPPNHRLSNVSSESQSPIEIPADMFNMPLTGWPRSRKS